MPFLPNGIGASLGDQLVVGKPLTLSGDVWYVDDSGTDAVSPAGKQRNSPLATLAQAVTNAAAGDIIVLMDGHAETISTLIAITKNLTIVGEGQSDGKPTVKITGDAGESGPVLTVAGTNYFSLRNIWFEENLQDTSDNLMTLGTGTYYELVGCYFEAGDTANASLVALSDAAYSIRNTTFVSTATTQATRPHSAISGGNGGVVVLDGVVVDSGTVGWTHTDAVDLSTGVTELYLAAQSVSLLRGADVTVYASAEYHFNTQTSSGSVREG